jgi:cystine transport system ATP-binding protein
MSPTEVPPPVSEVLLRVHGLSKSFGANHVLRSIDLTIERGRVLALIGPSGSGKTTLLRCLNGLELADGGTINTPGELTLDFATPPAKSQLSALRDRSGMVFQHYNLFPHKTVLENVLEGPLVVQRRPRAEATASALELLARVGLSEKTQTYPFQLSGGRAHCNHSSCSSTNRPQRSTPNWSVTSCA